MTINAMASSPSSETIVSVRFRAIDGGQQEVPHEWAPALLELDVPPVDWTALVLTVNGRDTPVSLRRINGVVGVVADWPRSPVGTYVIAVSLGGVTTRSLVTINPAKISTEAFERLVDDLQTHLPASLAIAMQRNGALTAVDVCPPGEQSPAAELALLDRVVRGASDRPGLEEILGALEKDHHSYLQPVRFWSLVDRARRPEPRLIYQALMRAGNVDGSGGVRRVVDSRPEPTADVYENRLVKALVHEVDLRLRRLSKVARGQPREVCQVLIRDLQRVRRGAGFLDNVRLPSAAPVWVTMVLLRRPPYKAALEAYLELHQRLVARVDVAGLDAPLENLPDLYEDWAILQLLLALLRVTERRGLKVTMQRLFQRVGNELLVKLLPAGESAVELHDPVNGTVVSVIPQRTYGAGGDLRSFSFRQIPDLVIEIRRPDSRTTVLLFDAKYKLDGELVADGVDQDPLKVDIDKMHAYRDSIVDAEGRRVVEYAAILYPGGTRKFGRSGDHAAIEAIRAYPGEMTAAFSDALEATFSAALGHTPS